ncbi:MAG: hypothetical protein ACE5JJ_09290, partial [Nitrospinota bacterium]
RASVPYVIAAPSSRRRLTREEQRRALARQRTLHILRIRGVGAIEARSDGRSVRLFRYGRPPGSTALAAGRRWVALKPRPPRPGVTRTGAR